MIWPWLRRKLGIAELEMRHDVLHRHVVYLNQWVRNLDLALQELQMSNEPRDMRKMAAQIRDQVMAIKGTFPVKMGDVK